MTKEHIKDWDWNMRDGFSLSPLPSNEGTPEKEMLAAITAALDVVHFRLCGSPNNEGVDIWQKILSKSETGSLSSDLLLAIGCPQKAMLIARFDFSDRRLLSVRNRNLGILFLMNKEVKTYKAYAEKPQNDVWMPIGEPVELQIDSVLPILQEEIKKTLNWY